MGWFRPGGPVWWTGSILQDRFGIGNRFLEELVEGKLNNLFALWLPGLTFLDGLPELREFGHRHENFRAIGAKDPERFPHQVNTGD